MLAIYVSEISRSAVVLFAHAAAIRSVQQRLFHQQRLSPYCAKSSKIDSPEATRSIGNPSESITNHWTPVESIERAGIQWGPLQNPLDLFWHPFARALLYPILGRRAAWSHFKHNVAELCKFEILFTVAVHANKAIAEKVHVGLSRAAVMLKSIETHMNLLDQMGQC